MKSFDASTSAFKCSARSSRGGAADSAGPACQGRRQEIAATTIINPLTAFAEVGPQ